MLLTARTLVMGCLIAQGLFAQPTVAPTNSPVGPVRGEDIGGYNIVNSFETGYRFRSVGGNLGKYRSDVNFGNGIRLLGSNLTIHSKEGHGKYFDELLLSTQGLGNDPYQISTFRLQKNRIYRYDLLWRLSEYYNPAQPVADGLHLMDTSRRMQDHSFTFLPQSPLRLFLGYSRNAQSGPALTTVQLFDLQGDQFPLFSDIRRSQNEYRFGGELRVAGVLFSFLRGWEYFKDDTEESVPQPVPGVDPADQTTLRSFNRAHPYHGSTKSWRLNLRSDRSRLYAFNGRFTNSEGRRDFIFDESAFGTDRFATARNRQILVFGAARRPVTTASLTVNVFPADRLTLSNHTAYHHTRIDGDGRYRELNNANLTSELFNFQFLGVRTLLNSTDLNFRAAKWIGFYSGYRFSTRRIRSIERLEFQTSADQLAAEQDNQLHSGIAGVRIQPVKRLSILLDAEIGRANRPFYPISERNYHAFGGRVQYKAGSLVLAAAARTNYNTNSVSFSAHSSRARNYSADASWTPRTWFGFDANYSKLHLDTLTGIAYFFNEDLIQGDRSVYISNIHSASAAARFVIRSSAELYFGYSRVQDVGNGDGRSAPALIYGRPLAESDLQPFPSLLGFQTFPLTFESPMARLSVRLHPNVRWNVGYQHYRYNEDQFIRQNYRAHTGFTSITWSF